VAQAGFGWLVAGRRENFLPLGIGLVEISRRLLQIAAWASTSIAEPEAGAGARRRPSVCQCEVWSGWVR
jgi:hypothetical protein